MGRGVGKILSRERAFQQFVVPGLIKDIQKKFHYGRGHLYSDYPEFLYKLKSKPDIRREIVDEHFYHLAILSDGEWKNRSWNRRVHLINNFRRLREPAMPDPVTEREEYPH